MAGAKISLEVDDRQVLEALSELTAHADNLEPAFRDIGEAVTISTRTRIEHGGPAPDGTPWKPLSPVTRQRKKKNKDKVLIYYGRLLGSIHPEVQADQVTVGTNVVYAAAQQFGMAKGYAGTSRRGSPIPWGDIPARPFLGISEDDKREVLEILQEHIGLATQTKR